VVSGGSGLPNANENGEQIWVCERDETYTYNQKHLLPLLEKFNEAELKACYVGPHTTPVEGKFLITPLKAVASRLNVTDDVLMTEHCTF